MVRKEKTGTAKEGQENYLERRPKPASGLFWTADKKELVTLYRENTGMMNRLAQKLFGRPRITQIHLDEMGSYIWQMMDGERSLLSLGALMQGRFGKEAVPLYERLAKYVQILDSCRLLEWAQKPEPDRAEGGVARRKHTLR